MDLAPNVFGQTQLHPTALAFTLLSALALLLVQRRHALVPVLLVMCFMPVGQRIVIASIDIDMTRIALLTGWIRVLVRGELPALRLCAIDWVFLLWRLVTALLFIARRWDFGAVILKAGESFDALGCYFLIRVLVRSPADLLAVIRVYAAISIPLGAAMLVENSTGRNLFAAFGGVPEFTPVRAGRLRCMGAFPHPILAGSVAASFFALSVGLWLARRRERLLATGAVAGSLAAVLTSASSGPLSALLFVAGALAFWPLRRYLRVALWSASAAVVFLAFYMKQPIWHLFARINIVGGSTGWHRAALIESAIDRFREWGLAGVDRSTGYYLIDVTNHYLLEGVRGGLPSLTLFTAIPFVAFRAVGSALSGIDRMRWLPSEDRLAWKILTWALGCSLLAHAVSFTGVAYFGQALLLFYANVALIATNLQLVAETEPARAPQPAPVGRAVSAAGGMR